MEEYKYKFSIIMSIYNVEKYLEEAIESIIKQDIGFEENVQLILVNDGSTDNSEEICIKYKKMFPNNVVYAKKENGGISSAKNMGLRYRSGKYVNFFDSDDKLEKNTLTEVEKFFDKNENIISMVAIPLVFFEAQKGFHPKYKYMGNTNRIINLDYEPYNFVLSSASVFYKTEIFNNIIFDEEMVGEEDTKLNFRIYELDRCFGYVCEKNVKYNYRKRIEGGSIVDSSTDNVKNYFSVIRLLDEVTENESADTMPDFKKELILYETRSRLKFLNDDLINKEDYTYIMEKYKKYINMVGEKFILTNSKWINDFDMKYFYLSILDEKEKNFYVSENGFIRYNGINIMPVNKLKVDVKRIYFTKKNICLDLLFWNYNFENLQLIAKTKDGKVLDFTEKNVIESSYDIKFGIHDLCKTTLIKLELPYKKQKFSFYTVDTKNGIEYKINNIVLNIYNSLTLKDKKIKIFHKDYNVKYFNSEFVIKKYRYSSLKYNLDSYKEIKKKYNHKAKFRLFSRRKKKYILISDRPEKAGDNGEAIFKYINKNMKNISKNTYYVIDKNNKDYSRMKKYGKVVKLRSLKHKFLFLNAKLIMSSHMHAPFYNPFNGNELKYYRDLLNYKFVWLQHGITQNDISSAANKYAKGINYVVLATNKEHDEFLKDKYFYNEKELCLTGFPRYDYLENNSENIITIAPTWRAYLSGPIREDGFHEIKAGFENSDYYINYSSILKNVKLLEKCKERGLKIKFVLHPGMAGYKNLFKKYENDIVEIVGAEDVNYSKMFSESNLLITDYSSIFFDFAYLKKPVIYYQFDKDMFYKDHYKKGYFQVENDGFGDVISDGKQLLKKINYYIDNNFIMEEKYVSRVDNTYKFTDKNNCKRLIDYLKNQKVI